MAKAKRAKKSKKSKGRKKGRTAAQKAATRALVARNRACPPGGKKRRAKKGKARKGGRKKGRSPAQKAATKRMLAANKASKPKGARKSKRRKGGKRRTAKRAVSTGAFGTRLSHVEKKVNDHDKTLKRHSSQISTLSSTERKMKQILGAKGLSSKAALPPKMKAAIGKQIKLGVKKAVREDGPGWLSRKR